MATLRQIIAALGEKWLDAEFSVRVYDGYNNSEHSNVNAHYSNFWRHHAGPEGKDLHLGLNVELEKSRLVKTKA